MGQGAIFSCVRQRVIPSGQDGAILPARVASCGAKFDSTCPLPVTIYHIYLFEWEG